LFHYTSCSQWQRNSNPLPTRSKSCTATKANSTFALSKPIVPPAAASSFLSVSSRSRINRSWIKLILLARCHEKRYSSCVSTNHRCHDRRHNLSNTVVLCEIRSNGAGNRFEISPILHREANVGGYNWACRSLQQTLAKV